jgi:hypothetical protein
VVLFEARADLRADVRDPDPADIVGVRHRDKE